jgi:hypothetical protein
LPRNKRELANHRIDDIAVELGISATVGDLDNIIAYRTETDIPLQSAYEPFFGDVPFGVGRTARQCPDLAQNAPAEQHDPGEYVVVDNLHVVSQFGDHAAQRCIAEHLFLHGDTALCGAYSLVLFAYEGVGHPALGGDDLARSLVLIGKECRKHYRTRDDDDDGDDKPPLVPQDHPLVFLDIEIRTGLGHLNTPCPGKPRLSKSHVFCCARYLP